MKSLVYVIAGASAVAAYFIAKSQRASTPEPVEVLAHELQEAWADHHTVV